MASIYHLKCVFPTCLFPQLVYGSRLLVLLLALYITMAISKREKLRADYHSTHGSHSHCLRWAMRVGREGC